MANKKKKGPAKRDIRDLTPRQAKGEGLEKRYREAKHKAALTVQPHVLYARREVRELVVEKLNDGVKPGNRKKPFNYAIEDGQLYVVLDHPILRVEAKEIIDPISAAIRASREAKALEPGVSQRQADRFLPGELEVQGISPAQLRAMRAAEAGELTAEEKAAREEREALEKGKVDLGKILFKKFPLLTLTSKMGCYSFNLPAGPAAHKFWGTCLSAGYGFPMLDEKDRPKKTSRWWDAGTGPDGNIDYSKVDRNRWLCSGCYGLKGLYGSPMIYTMMECRKQFVEAMLAMNRDGLVEILTRAIRMGQAQSMTERFFLEQMGPEHLRQAWKIPDPHYFRIHDVGDAWVEPYFLVWCDVARNFQEPHKVKALGLTLPAVKFWMPTRMWMMPGRVGEHFICQSIKKGCVPPNMTIRPSAAHFGDKAPALGEAGLANGSGATGMSDLLQPNDIAAAELVVGPLKPRGTGWICPAYLAPEAQMPGIAKFGGGAEWTPKGKKTKYLELVGGACARAWGPDGEPPAPKGRGCRACWDRPDLSIVYPEH